MIDAHTSFGEEPKGKSLRASALEHPLPAALRQRRHRFLSAYRDYPVFGLPWLWRRALSAAGISWAAGAVVASLWWGHEGDYQGAWSIFLHFGLGLGAMTSVGPTLATAARHLTHCRRGEVPWVVLALVVGVAAAAAGDAWASDGIESVLQGESVRYGLSSSAALPPSAEPSALSAVLGGVAALGVYCWLGGGVALWHYFRQSRELVDLDREQHLQQLRVRHQELEAQLGLLQAQIEPHFLFNTLASVHSLVETEPAVARSLLDSLSTFLRATIPKLRQDAARMESPLGLQLDLCTSYLRVMELRLGGRLRFEVRAPAELMQASFPPLLLMTLVENAVTHGIEPKAGSGTIELVAERAGERLRVTVQDDGVGLQEAALGREGVGLQNLRRWLEARFGARANFSLASRVGGGVTATVEIPLEWPEQAS